jgi:pyrroline-5-carboxylate reductase
MTLSPPYLVIGSGNMGVPVIASWLKNGVTPEEMVIITGETGGKTSPENTRIALQQQGIAEDILDKVRFTARDKVAEAEILAAGTVLFATKPQYFEEVKTAFSRTTQTASTLVSIAAGLSCEDLKALTPNADIIRTMPNLAQTLWGYYIPSTFQELDIPAQGAARSVGFGAQSPQRTKCKEYATTQQTPKTTLQVLENLMQGMGEALALPNEGRVFNDFLVHAGCGHAFAAIAQLKQADAAIFYQHWLRLLNQDFPSEQAEKILRAVWQGTEALLARTGENPLVFANRVRSGRGVTNAGLLCMGIPVPEEERFGTAQERDAQNKIATDFARAFSPEMAIIPAILASKARAVGMKLNPQNPLFLAGDYASFEAIRNYAIANWPSTSTATPNGS